MSVTLTLSTTLRTWINENLARGAPPEAMIDALVNRNFEPGVARGLVDAFRSAQAAGRYIYEAPRMAPGHLLRACDRDIRVLQRLQSPILATLENVLSATECAQLIELARPRLRRSTVIDAATGANSVAGQRSSEGVFFRLRETPLIAQLDERLAAIMNSPVENGEGLQLLRYQPGGQYPPHFDFLDPATPGGEQSIARSGQRVSTLIVYLNDVIEGGETVFPEVGLSVVPRRGNGLYFEYTNSRMQLDLRSAHGGAPVIQGEKWIVTKWMRSRPFVPNCAAQPGWGREAR